MRKALIGILLAASAATPALAQEENQEGHGRFRAERAEVRAEQRAERIQQRNEERAQGQGREQRREAREERREARPEQPAAQADQAEARQEWREAREDRREARVERPVFQAPSVEVRQQAEVRGGEGRWRGGGDASAWQGRDRSTDRDAARRQVQAARGDRGSRQGRDYGQAQQGQPTFEQQVGTAWGGGDRRREDARRDRRDDRRDDWRRDRRDDRRDGSWGQRDGRNGSWNDGRRDHRDWRRDWNRSWRHDNRYDWQRYRSSNRNLYRWGQYYAPYRGYSYRRLSIGLFLDQLFYSSRYRITNPWQYRLPAAPYGTYWVRYWDDALLVDVYSGEVVDVIYDFFW